MVGQLISALIPDIRECTYENGKRNQKKESEKEKADQNRSL